MGEAVLAVFIGWGLKGFFIFRAAKAADAESLRLLFIQLPILTFSFWLCHNEELKSAEIPHRLRLAFFRPCVILSAGRSPQSKFCGAKSPKAGSRTEKFDFTSFRSE